MNTENFLPEDKDSIPSHPTNSPSSLPSYGSYTINNSANTPSTPRTVIPFHEHSVVETISSTIRLIKFNPRAYIIFPFLVSLVCLLVIALISLLSGGSVLANLELAELDSTNTGFATLSSLVSYISIAINLLIFFTSIILAIAGTRFTLNSVRGVKLSLSDAFQLPWPRLGINTLRYIGLTLIYFFGTIAFIIIISLISILLGADATGQNKDLFLFILILLSIVIGIFFLIRLSLVTPAIVAEDIGVIAAIRRSWELTRKRFWHIFAVILLGFALLILAFTAMLIIVAFAITAFDSSTASLISGSVAYLLYSSFCIPFSIALGNMIYVNMRFSKENFGEQLLSTLPN